MPTRITTLEDRLALNHFPRLLAELGAERRSSDAQHGETASLPADQTFHMTAPPRPTVIRFNGAINAMTNGTKNARPIAPYIGGKRVLAPRICKIIDAHQHRTYAEPFVGMGGVFLRRASRPKAEFINDYGREVYTLFRVIQEHYVAFLDLMRFQITTQANFERLRATDPETLTDLQRAARFLYVQRVAFGGRVRSPVFGLATERPARFNITTLEPDIEALHERLSGVTIMCLDFAEFIRRVDRRDTLFYLDPPYWGCEKDYGPDVFAREDFERLSDCLKTIKGQFLLSLNDRPEVRALFSWARIKQVDVTYSISSQTGNTAAKEVLISNFDIGGD